MGEINVKVGIDVSVENYDGLSFFWNGLLTYLNVTTVLSNTGTLSDFRRVPLKKLDSSKNIVLSLKLTDNKDSIKVSFNFDNIAGLGSSVSLDVSSVWGGMTGAAQEVKPKIMRLEDSDDLSDDDDFSDDGIDLNDIFERAASVKHNHPLPPPTVATTVTDNNINNNICDYDALATPEVSIDNTFTRTHVKQKDGYYKCNHKCKDKTKCRHLCCKEGIPGRTVSKGCNHICKDKSKCRHLCCRESLKIHSMGSSGTNYSNISSSNTSMKTQRTLNQVLTLSQSRSTNSTSVTANKELINNESNNNSTSIPTKSVNKNSSKDKKLTLKQFAYKSPEKSPDNRSVYMKSLLKKSDKKLKGTAKKLNNPSVFDTVSKAFEKKPTPQKRKKPLMDLFDSDFESDDGKEFSDALDEALSKSSRVKIVKKKKPRNDTVDSPVEPNPHEIPADLPPSKPAKVSNPLFVPESDASAEMSMSRLTNANEFKSALTKSEFNNPMKPSAMLADDDIATVDFSETKISDDFSVEATISAINDLENCVREFSTKSLEIADSNSKPPERQESNTSVEILSDDELEISYSVPDGDYDFPVNIDTPSTTTEMEHSRAGDFAKIDNDVNDKPTDDRLGDMLDFLGSDVELEF
ncbi:unnamed protein product [Ambrosiozyma monospora]|uniref:Unnamed protein product n=1 Tax=Ambrosiozyma monospora TaxID=43982 RepID=A0ACB5STJ5_AMBMO|nr:unnamed protein product [Ambrosiozyma monospora]